VYEKLGHAETVQLEVSSRGSEAEQQMAAFADTYFSQFIKTPFGMMRSVSPTTARHARQPRPYVYCTLWSMLQIELLALAHNAMSAMAAVPAPYGLGSCGARF